MVLSEAEAETRLAELRRQRETIDRAITDLTLYLELGRRLRGGVAQQPGQEAFQQPTDSSGGDRTADRSGCAGRETPVTVSTGTASTPAPSPVSISAPAARPEPALDGTVPDIVVARRYGRALIEAAVAVLAEAGKPLHVGEIEARLSARGFSMPGQQDPVAALNTRLWKRSGPGGPVRRLGDAVYALPAGDGPEPR